MDAQELTPAQRSLIRDVKLSPNGLFRSVNDPDLAPLRRSLSGSNLYRSSNTQRSSTIQARLPSPRESSPTLSRKSSSRVSGPPPLNTIQMTNPLSGEVVSYSSDVRISPIQVSSTSPRGSPLSSPRSPRSLVALPLTASTSTPLPSPLLPVTNIFQRNTPKPMPLPTAGKGFLVPSANPPSSFSTNNPKLSGNPALPFSLIPTQVIGSVINPPQGYNPKLDLTPYEVNSSRRGFFGNIEDMTVDNDHFRAVVFTDNTQQLVLMSLKPNEDIGMEIHYGVSQFFRVESGEGILQMENADGAMESIPFKDGSSFIIPNATRHTVRASTSTVKLYTIYSPPNHPYDRIDKFKPQEL